MDWGAFASQLGTGNILGAVGTGLGGILGATSKKTGAGGSTIVGGTITGTHAGYIQVKVGNNTVWIKRAKHRRYSRRGSGGGMNSMLKQAMQFKMLSQAMK